MLVSQVELDHTNVKQGLSVTPANMLQIVLSGEADEASEMEQDDDAEAGAVDALLQASRCADCHCHFTSDVLYLSQVCF